MVQLLVSVRNVSEAMAAVAAGAQLIDIKEPRNGSLGAAAPTTWREIRQAIPVGFPVSAALGELRQCRREEDWSALEGFDFSKIGLSGCSHCADYAERWRRMLDRQPPSVGRVAVAYADFLACESPHPEEVIDVGKNLGCGALLLDTYRKDGKTLFHYLDSGEVQSHVERAHAADMIVVLAGSLDGNSLPTATALGPDYVAVRGAVCRGGRGDDLDPGLVASCVAAISSFATD
jgi:(5-formylfuran-3-yl)methyl phosphate synthase